MEPVGQQHRRREGAGVREKKEMGRANTDPRLRTGFARPAQPAREGKEVQMGWAGLVVGLQWSLARPETGKRLLIYLARV